MAQSETTIAQNRLLDIDTLMSDNFDIEKILPADDISRLNQLSKFGDPKEIRSDLMLESYMKAVGITGDDSLAANKLAAQTVFKAKTRLDTWSALKEGWNNNRLQIMIADIRVAEMNGLLSHDQAQKQVSAIKSRIKENTATGLASFAKSAAGVAPMILDTSASGAKYAIPAGAAAAGVAAASGAPLAGTVASTGIGAPLAVAGEGLTITGAALTFGSMGFMYGSATRAKDIEAGLMYDELMEFKDDNGNRIDPAIAANVANVVGVINGLLELAQIGDIIKTIPGGKKLIARAQRETILSLAKNKTILKTLTKGGLKYAGHVGTETLTEVSQETTNVIFGEFAKYLSNELDNTGFAPAAKKDIADRILNTAIESAKAFSVIAAPGNIINTTIEMLPEKKGNIETDVTENKAQPINRISRIMSSEKIVTRLDVNSLGKTMVDIQTELPPKKQRAKTVKEKILTPEEEYTLQQTEATLKATEEFEITPNLYIGNVTARMKEVMADQFGVDADMIRGFTDGAWPTKRTKITLTMDEARSLLAVMEQSLQDRVDNNKLKTDSDLARANADWGDIKELRSKLGLPKTVRPFRVIREKGTRTITIEKVRERIEKTTHTGSLDVVSTTKIQQLNDVLKRVAKAAREGWAGGKKEAREHYQLLQYIKKLKQLRENLIGKITAEPSEKIDFFYREAIKGLQNAIDWKTGTDKKKLEKETLRSLLEKNPEKSNEIPEDLIAALNKKDVADLSMNDLLLLNSEINRLKELGKLKSELYRKQRARAIENETSAMVENINKAKTGILPTVERANSLRPMRIFDYLDGGKNFAGRIYNFFYGITNENYNAELTNTDNRQKAFKQRMSELGIGLKDLVQKRVIDNITFTVDEMLTVYAGWQNDSFRHALMYGGIEISNSKTPVEITEELHKKIVDALTQNEINLGDTVIQEYEDNSYGRLRNAVIAAENRDMGRENRYIPKRSAKVEYTSTEQELLDELSYRHFINSQIGPAKGMTIPRKNIPPEYQKPVKSGLVSQWFQEVRKQEHYINNALHIKDMQAILRKEEFRNAIRDKFGESMLDSVEHYVKRIANPDYYKTFNDMENASKIARRHVAIGYIAFNFSSIANQVPAIMSYWANSSAADIIKSSIDAMVHPLQSYERAKDIHYQVSHQNIEREMEELENANKSAYNKIISRIGRSGMFGLFSMDRAIRVIGINAVYDYNIRNGMSETEARDAAVKTTLLTQEASSPKDLAKLYSSNEYLNWATMFTNQLNQLYNISTYDIPQAWKNKNYREAARSAISLAVMAMCIWMIQTGELPDEPEDALRAFSEQFLGSIPIFGNTIVSSMNGWQPRGAVPFQMVHQTTQAAKNIFDGEYEKALEKLVEPVAIGAGFPYQAAKETWNFIENEIE